uniref:Uncharacterized protein n=1 Tax=Pithovirus LCPAC403 TaxID=2506596 RepID=A0A481ZDL5_9VIRU|nr:MAG: hypothetical protein LCPAC403_02730 [Pithovirus LCPAC403]
MKENEQCSHCHKCDCKLDLSFKDQFGNWCNKCVEKFEIFTTEFVKNIHIEAKIKDIKCDLTMRGMKELFFKYERFTFASLVPPFTLEGQCSKCYQCYGLGIRNFLELLSRDEDVFDWCAECIHDFNTYV